MDKRLKYKARNYKPLKGNIGSRHFNINESKILFDLPPRVTKIKIKTNKSDIIKFKSF